MSMQSAVVLVILLFAISGTSFGRHIPSSLVASACAHTSYPALCVRTLAAAAASLRNNPTDIDIAIAAVEASLSSARSVSAKLRSIPNVPSPLPGTLRDCLQQLSDSADELQKTKAELNRLKMSSNDHEKTDSRMQLDNACTWVSAALTNEDTCLDATKDLDAAVRDAVATKVRALERVTTNGLYFVSHLAYSRNHH